MSLQMNYYISLNQNLRFFGFFVRVTTKKFDSDNDDHTKNDIPENAIWRILYS